MLYSTNLQQQLNVVIFIIKRTVSLCITVLVISCNAPSGKRLNINCTDCFITKEETAVKIAEAIAMETYGEDKIKSQRPYNVTIVNDTLWKIEGTFNRIGFGGVFSVTLSAKDGRIIEVIHGK